MSHNACLRTHTGMGHATLEDRPNPLYVKCRLLDLYIRVVEQELVAERRFDAADQLARAARSVMNNVSEAQSSSSRKDFVHRLRLAQRELNEASTMISSEWPHSSELRYHGDLIIDIAFEIYRLLASSIGTATRNMKSSHQ
jgi:four helix bundle protein